VPSLQAWLLLHTFSGARLGQGQCLNNTGHQFSSLIGRRRRQDIGHHQYKIIQRLLPAECAILEPAPDFLDNVAMQAGLAIDCH